MDKSHVRVNFEMTFGSVHYVRDILFKTSYLLPFKMHVYI